MTKQIFEETILKTSEYLGVKVEIVEKDYYVTLFLKELVTAMPDIIFKGGTSLSKCYHVIKRFFGGYRFEYPIGKQAV